MRILSIVHQADAGPGVFARAARSRGAKLVEWRPQEEAAPAEALDHYAGLLVLGGAMHPDQEEEHPWLMAEKRLLAESIERQIPTLGVCLGAELLAEAAGGSTKRLPSPEIGWREVRLTPEGRADPVLGGLPEHFACLQWHTFTCEPPPDSVDLARGAAGAEAFRIGWAWGIQFHAEVTAEIVTAWLDHHAEDGDAVAAGFEPEPVRAETPKRIGESNRVGEALFSGFLDRVAARTPG